MKLLTFAAIVALCGAAKLDRKYLPPSGANFSGGSPGAIRAPFEKQPDYQKFLIPPLESEPSVPFSQQPKQLSPESNAVGKHVVPSSQGILNQNFQDLHDNIRNGGSIPQGSKPKTSDSFSRITTPESSERLTNTDTGLSSSVPTYQGSGQYIQSRPGQTPLQGSRLSVSDVVSTVPISDGMSQKFHEENLPIRPDSPISQGTRPSLSDSTLSAPKNEDEQFADYNIKSKSMPSLPYSVSSTPISQTPSQRVPGSRDNVRPEMSSIQGLKPSLGTPQTIDSKPSYEQEPLQGPFGNRYDSSHTGNIPSEIDYQKSSQYTSRPKTGHETQAISKLNHDENVPKSTISNQYIPSREHSGRPSYESSISQQNMNYQDGNQNPGLGRPDSSRLQYQNNRGSVPFPTATDSQTEISDNRYQKPSPDSISAQNNGPFKVPTAKLPPTQDSNFQLPKKGGDSIFQSETTPFSQDTDIDYDDDIFDSGIKSKGRLGEPDEGGTRDGQSPLIKSAPRNQNHVQNAGRPQASFERTAGIIRYDNVINPDGTFAYDFETENGIKAQEYGTSANGVQAEGDFSYVGDDGKIYSVTYTADERGYQPQGDHLPTSPPIPDAILKSLEIIAQQEATGDLDDGSYDESKYGPEQNGVNNNYDDINGNIPESRSNDDIYSKTKMKSDNDNDLDSIEIKAAEPGSDRNDFEDITYDHGQDLKPTHQPGYGSRIDSVKPVNDQSIKYFRTNIERKGTTYEPKRFETTLSPSSRRPTFDGSSVSEIKATESPSSTKYASSSLQTLIPGSQSSKVDFERTTNQPEFNSDAGEFQQVPSKTFDYTSAIPGSISQTNNQHQIAYPTIDVDSQNARAKYPQKTLPKSSTQYLPAKQGSSVPGSRHQDTQSKISPNKFDSNVEQKQQLPFSIDYTSSQINPSFPENENYQTNSPMISLQYTTNEPGTDSRKYQETLPKSSLTHIPSAFGSAVQGNQDYENNLSKRPSVSRPIIPGSFQSDVRRYQTPSKEPLSGKTIYRNGFQESVLKKTESPEGTIGETGNIQRGNEYDEEINKSPINAIEPSIKVDNNKPERFQEYNYSNDRGTTRFNRPEYGSTTTSRQPFLDETRDEERSRYSEERNRQPISKFNYQSPATQTSRPTTIKSSQYQTNSDVTINKLNEATKSPYVPDNLKNVQITDGPYRAITTIVPEINREYEVKDNYNVQPNTGTEDNFGRRIESRPQTNILSKYNVQTSSYDINNEDGYNYKIPKTQFNYNNFPPSSKPFNQPEQGHDKTQYTTEDYDVTDGNQNTFTTTISPISTQRNRYPSITTVRPQSTVTFRNNINRYNQVPSRVDSGDSDINGINNLQPNYGQDNLQIRPHPQQYSNQHTPSDRNLNKFPQNVNTHLPSQKPNRVSSHFNSRGDGDNSENPELQGEYILDDQLDSTSQRPFGRPQSNVNNMYSQNDDDNTRLRPTSFTKEVSVPNLFTGTGDTFPGSRLDSTSQRPFGRPQSNVNNIYSQNDDDNTRLRPTSFTKEVSVPNLFTGTGETFPGSRRPPSFSPETGYKY